MKREKAPKDYLQTVYWVEFVGVGKYEVRCGNLLAEYDNWDGKLYIVTLGHISSCVVRHIPEYYTEVKDAYIEKEKRERLAK